MYVYMNVRNIVSHSLSLTHTHTHTPRVDVATDRASARVRFPARNADDNSVIKQSGVQGSRHQRDFSAAKPQLAVGSFPKGIDPPWYNFSKVSASIFTCYTKSL
jgi:hypothetical protein